MLSSLSGLSSEFPASTRPEARWPRRIAEHIQHIKVKHAEAMDSQKPKHPEMQKTTRESTHFVWTIVVECNYHGKEIFDQLTLKQFVEKIVCYTRF